MIDLAAWRGLVLDLPWWTHAAGAACAFLALYLIFSTSAWWLSQRILPRLGIGAVIDARPLPSGQIGSEIRWSLVSILVFALYGAATVACERAGIIHIRWQETVWTMARDLCLLTLFNEVHFYLVHRLLHTRWLLRHVHRIHHRSVIATPFSTYAFHPVEAAALSSVMLCALLVIDLGIATVLLFPVASLALNTIGHLNYALLRSASAEDLLAGCRRHSDHHRRSHGNFGFYLPFLDRWLGSGVAAPRDGDHA